MCDINFGTLVGLTLDKVEHKFGTREQEQIVFTTNTGISYRLYHNQDCCESVDVEEIIGDLDDLVGVPILRASEDTSIDNPGPLDKHDESYTWTFYNISTIKGTVTIRWYGVSNGYYSESVDFEKIKDENTLD